MQDTKPLKNSLLASEKTKADPLVASKVFASLKPEILDFLLFITLIGIIPFLLVWDIELWKYIFPEIKTFALICGAGYSFLLYWCILKTIFRL